MPCKANVGGRFQPLLASVRDLHISWIGHIRYTLGPALTGDCLGICKRCVQRPISPEEKKKSPCAFLLLLRLVDVELAFWMRT